MNMNKSQKEFMEKFYVTLNRIGMTRGNALALGISEKDINDLCEADVLWDTGADINDELRCPYASLQIAYNAYDTYTTNKMNELRF